MKKQAKIYTISAAMAQSKGIPRSFVAAELVKTGRGAVYLYGHGTKDPHGSCAKCGRLLTHPGSILIGIGPECLGSWAAREYRLDHLSTRDIAELKTLTESKVVDCWLPVSVVRSEEDSDEIIDIPDDHKMLQTNGSAKAPEPKKAYMDPSGKFVTIKFPYDPAMVNQVKTLEGRRWDATNKCWTAWASNSALSKLLEWGFELDEKCHKLLKPAQAIEDVKISLDIPGLYPFQVDGVKFLEAHNGVGLIGDEMGLGKTVQALGWLSIHREARPAVIVCPASIKINWEREARKWLKALPASVGILSGTKPTALAIKKINIINYDILGNWLDVILSAKPQVVIVDESHYIKNSKAQRTKAVRELCKACPHKIFLSGTPITSRPAEFFTTLNLIDPREFNSWIRFTTRYCNAKHNGFGWDVTGASNIAELHDRLNGKMMVRRKKADVLKDLPSKKLYVVPMEIQNRREYDYAEEELLSWVKEKFGAGRANSAAQAEALARFSYLKQLAAEGKLEMAIQWIKNSLDANGKLVIFSVHHSVIDKLSEELRIYNPVIVDGRVSIEKRQAAVDRFQNDPSCRVFLGNVKAAGVGITLTAASNVVFVEMGWTPGEMEQAADRIHRIGQEASSVSVWYLVAAETIEEEVADILDSKRVVLNKVLDGQDTDESSMLRLLIQNRAQ